MVIYIGTVENKADKIRAKTQCRDSHFALRESVEVNEKVPCKLNNKTDSTRKSFATV